MFTNAYIFLEIFSDPDTGENFELQISDRNGDFIETGKLIGSKEYPIIRGIPRFTDCQSTKYVKSFSYQWKKWPRIQFDSENVGKPMEGHTSKMWESITGIDTNDLYGTVIGDFGCGPGRFIDVVRRKNGTVIGVDNSNAVEEAESNFKFDKNVLVIQADIMNLPLKIESIDGAYSIGVLHHTPSASQAFSEIVKIVKSTGWISTSVYAESSYYNSTIVRIYRKIFNLLWPLFGFIPPLLYTYFAVYVLIPLKHIPLFGRLLYYIFMKNYLPFIDLPDKRWSILDTFDSLTPTNQCGHTTYEIYRWYKDNNLSNIEPTAWGNTSFRGFK